MNELHLFAGAGGGILGGMLLGHTCVCAVEIEPYPRAVLLQRQQDGILPRFPIWDDVQTFDGKPWRGQIDILCGGFPCQDISAAGKGEGITGTRSGLWGEMARIIGEIRPRHVFVENSPLLVGRGLAVVLSDLAEMGYDATWGVLGAGHIGGWHLRERVWMVASDNLQERIKRLRPETVSGKFRIPGSKNVRSFKDLQKRSDLPPSLIWGTRNGIPNYVDRIAAIGNGQVPQVAATAFRILSQDI